MLKAATQPTYFTWQPLMDHTRSVAEDLRRNKHPKGRQSSNVLLVAGRDDIGLRAKYYERRSFEQIALVGDEEVPEFVFLLAMRDCDELIARFDDGSGIGHD